MHVVATQAYMHHLSPSIMCLHGAMSSPYWMHGHGEMLGRGVVREACQPCVWQAVHRCMVQNFGRQ